MGALAQLVSELERQARTAPSAESYMRLLVRRLAETVPTFNWVGFYLIDERDPQLLVLGPYVGAPTPHTRIPLTQGICGAAAATGETIVVDDVNADPRYLACSLDTKSEIVAPIYAEGRVVGELDIDSHTPAALSAEDRGLVERCAALVGAVIERTRFRSSAEQRPA